jgi:hypothetical protein
LDAAKLRTLIAASTASCVPGAKDKTAIMTPASNASKRQRGTAMAKREVVVITGASAGVGRATVREFAKHGAWIGLIARGKDGLNGARREVEAVGGKALVLPVDLADPDHVEWAAREVERKLGPIVCKDSFCKALFHLKVMKK